MGGQVTSLSGLNYPDTPKLYLSRWKIGADFLIDDAT
jgi:hypothetical protein